jgi:hypothetical protein
MTRLRPGFGAAGESTRIGKRREPRIMRMTQMPQVFLGGKLCRASAVADAKSRWIGLVLNPMAGMINALGTTRSIPPVRARE